MKKCAYCGLENDDMATRCSGCGTADFVVNVTKAEGEAAWEKVAVVENEIEAERLAVELGNRSIPHVMHSYHDSAWDGLYQFAHGWGQVEASGQHSDAILSILKDIRQPPAESGANPLSDPDRTGTS